jgi:hypothetical protein
VAALDADHLEERANIGAGAYAEIGVEMLRTHRTGLVASARADVPMFELAPTHGDLRREYRERTYLLPLSMMVGVLFH